MSNLQVKRWVINKLKDDNLQVKRWVINKLKDE